MTDRDVVEHVCELWGTRLWITVPKVERFKTVFHTELVGGSAVALMLLLRPHLCTRRQQQIDEAIATFQPLRAIKHKRYFVSPEGGEEFDRYWLAGLLEGEASFGQRYVQSANPSPNVELDSTDEEVVQRVQSIWRVRYGVSVNIHLRPPREEGYKPQYHIIAHGPAARAIMADLEPLMGERRRARIAELIGDGVQLRLIGEARACYDVRLAA